MVFKFAECQIHINMCNHLFPKKILDLSWEVLSRHQCLKGSNWFNVSYKTAKCLSHKDTRNRHQSQEDQIILWVIHNDCFEAKTMIDRGQESDHRGRGKLQVLAKLLWSDCALTTLTVFMETKWGRSNICKLGRSIMGNNGPITIITHYRPSNNG